MEKEKEMVKNMSNNKIVGEIADRLGVLMNCPVASHPHLNLVFQELVERLKSWERKDARKLKIKDY